jgi:7-cyano-7-deazaguanine synthase
MNRTALVLFSGGQDSTTCLAWALSRFDRVETIGFDYRQRHRVELDCRVTVLAALKGIFPDWAPRLGQDRVIDLGMIKDLGDTALTSDVEIEMRASGLPNTFVPGRNILFLTTAGAVAYRRGIKHLVGGMCETDFSGYPDCRDDTMKALQATLNLAMESRLVIETPLMWLDKAATWRLANELGGDLFVDLVRLDTHTCYHGDRQHLHDWGYGCGKCPACDLRKVGYQNFRSSSVRRSPVGDPEPTSQIRPWRSSSREP